ncbi:MAG: hypothetical protein QOG88_1683 [Actinomycetota bacterium]|jgi:hypothetical protein|nr:hypothetical protein [Actinomycetota bacterium]
MASPGVHWRALRRDVTRMTRTARGLGSLPGFILIGGQRCGTTAVFHELRRHPAVGNPLRKEIHFFDVNHARGERWYRSHFPSTEEMAGKGARITGEASPSYLFHPDVPGRVQAMLPDARFIVLLRDPVIRAWSQWSLARALHREPLSFEDAVENEPERLIRALERKAADPADKGTEYRRVSYLARGDYAPQLRRWFDQVGRERVLVLVSEEVFSEPVREFRKVEAFLDLSVWEAFPGITQRYAKGGGGEGMSAETAARLREQFAPKIKDTEQLLGRDLPWAR